MYLCNVSTSRKLYLCRVAQSVARLVSIDTLCNLKNLTTYNSLIMNNTILKTKFKIYRLNMFGPLIDKAGLSWKGFNMPTDLGEDKPADDTSREETQRKKLERGWSGKTWPGKTVGPPVTADGGLQIHLLLFIYAKYTFIYVNS